MLKSKNEKINVQKTVEGVGGGEQQGTALQQSVCL